MIGQQTLNIGSFRRILQAVQSSRAFAGTFNKSTNPKYRIIGTSNKLMNPQDLIIGTSNESTNPQCRIIETSKKPNNPQDRITETLKESKIRTQTQKAAYSTHKSVYVQKIHLKRTRRRIYTQKPLNAHKNLYTYAKAAKLV